MTIKPPHAANTLSPGEAPQLNQTITRAYSTRLESIWFRDGTATSQKLFQSTEHGKVLFSATGSATVTKTYSLAEKQNQVVFAEAHALNSAIVAHVTSVTATSITIECGYVSGIAFSDVTTDQVTVYYKVVGSNP